jgi:hypothetical protein
MALEDMGSRARSAKGKECKTNRISLHSPIALRVGNGFADLPRLIVDNWP